MAWQSKTAYLMLYLETRHSVQKQEVLIHFSEFTVFGGSNSSIDKPLMKLASSWSTSFSKAHKLAIKSVTHEFSGNIYTFKLYQDNPLYCINIICRRFSFFFFMILLQPLALILDSVSFNDAYPSLSFLFCCLQIRIVGSPFMVILTISCQCCGF